MVCDESPGGGVRFEMAETVEWCNLGSILLERGIGMGLAGGCGGPRIMDPSTRLEHHSWATLP